MSIPAGTGFDPFSILGGVAGSALSGTSSASGRQYNNFNAPFNVGSGQQESSNEPTTQQRTGIPNFPSLPISGNIDVTTLVILGGAAWLATKILK